MKKSDIKKGFSHIDLSGVDVASVHVRGPRRKYLCFDV